jgi:hypothetical protein
MRDRQSRDYQQEKRLQFTGLFRKFNVTMTSRSTNGFCHLRRPRTENPGWVAV